MNNRIKKLTICIVVLLYCLFSGTSYAAANQLSSIDVLPGVESIASIDYTMHSQHRIVRGKNKLEGLFTLYSDEEDGTVYLEVQPQQLNKNYLATVTLESGVGESGIYSGQPLQDFLFYFRRVKDKLHFVVRNVKFRTGVGEPEQRSLDRSFSDSVLYALDIASIDSHSKSILVNLGDLLMKDFPGLTSLLKDSLQADYRLSENKSYFGDINSFPLNVEINSIYGFSAKEGADLVTVPDSRALTLKVHYSFSQLPEDRGYTPRIADDRVGYFITAFQDYSSDRTGEPFVRYINRWRLEPSQPELSLSPPQKPIVYWIENAVPLEYRDAIREGILMWNQAFEKIGLQNAIEVRQMPDDADWHPADVRYNTIRWFNSLDAGFAKGPTRVNPFTGEILDADIIVDANMVRSVQRDYRALMEGGGSKTAKTPRTPSFGEEDLCRDVDEEVCFSRSSSSEAAMGVLALSLLGEGIPSDRQMKEYVHQYLRYLIAHEVGHTLGLRHNFHGSTMLAPGELNNTEITHSKGLVGSVMDYLPVNIAPQGVQQGDYFPTTIGPYDRWAIEYGYKFLTSDAEKPVLEQIALASPQPELSYATDEDIWDINPLANLWDMSSDVLVYSRSQMDNARTMWQRLDRHYPLKGGSYSDLRVLFNRVMRYYSRNANLLTQYIGGQSFGRHHATDDTTWAFVPVSLEKQRQALATLQEYVFASDAFNFSPQLLNQLAPSRFYHWGNNIPVSRLDYPIHRRILYLQSAVLRSLLDGDRLERLRDIEFKSPVGSALSIPELFDSLQQGIWTEVLNKGEAKSISSVRRSLQRSHLDILLEMVLRESEVPEDGRTIAWYELRQLHKAIDSRIEKEGENVDIYTLAHLSESSDRISKALNAGLRSY